MLRLCVLFLAACMLMGGVSNAADSGAVPVTKIGVFDMQTIATESDAGKAAEAQMEAKYKPEKAKLDKQGEAIKKLAPTLKNPKTSENKKMQFLKDKQKLDNETRSFIRKVEQDQLKFRNEMITLVYNSAYEVAKAKGFNLIVDIAAGGVVYADPSMDLTQDILAEVNKQFKAKQGFSTPQADAPKADAPKEKAD